MQISAESIVLNPNGLIACVAGAKRGGRGGGRKAPLPFSLFPYPLPLSTPATPANGLNKLLSCISNFPSTLLANRTMTFLMASHGAYSNLGTQLGHTEQEILDWLAVEVNQQPFS